MARALPECPPEVSENFLSNSEYAEIDSKRTTSMLITDKDKMPEYATVVPKSKRTNAKMTTKDESALYSKVVPKSERAKTQIYSKVIPKSETEKASNVNVDKSPVYAVPKPTRNAPPETCKPTGAPSSEFSVVFTDIDVTKVVTKLPSTTKDYADKGPTYSNVTGHVLPAAKPFRRKVLFSLFQCKLFSLEANLYFYVDKIPLVVNFSLNSAHCGSGSTKFHTRPGN